MGIFTRSTRRTETAAAGADSWGVPYAVEVAADRVRGGDGHAAHLAITGYPAEVPLGWLEPLLSHPGRVDVSLHIDPVPQEIAASRLRRQRARLESSRRLDAERGSLDDPVTDAAAADAADLAREVARGSSRLHRVGVYVTVHARTPQLLDDAVAQVRAAAAGALLAATPLTWRQMQGREANLPLGVDSVQARRTMDTTAVAAAFPFASPDLPVEPGAVVYGPNLASPGVVAWDRWAQPNHNMVVLGSSGGGKSYTAKAELRRSLCHGVAADVVDHEDEYRRLVEALGGVVVDLGDPATRLNPLDLPVGDNAPTDALTQQALFTHTLVAVMIGAPDPAAKAALDRAIMGAYTRAGITADPRTHHRPAPVLADVVGLLAADTDPAAAGLALQLQPYVTGSYSRLFAGPSTVRVDDAHLVGWSIRDVPDELRPIATLLALGAIWRRVVCSPRQQRRLVLVDECWQLLAASDGARWLRSLAKRSRKYHAGLTVVTQDADDLLGSDLGRSIVANCATCLLLRQAPQVIDQVGEEFALTAGEKGFLLAAGVGEALLLGGNRRAALQVVASPEEADLFGTSPGEDPSYGPYDEFGSVA